MEIKELWKFQSPINCLHSLQFIYRTEDLIQEGNAFHFYSVKLLFDYYENGQTFNSGIAFGSTQAYRYTSDVFNKTPHDFSGVLVEYIDSAWLQELYKRNAEIAESWGIRHFAIHFSGHGTYEVIAQTFKILEVKQGLLEL